MASLNRVMLIGNLGADPETRHAQNGSVRVTFRVAVTDKWKDKGGEWQEKTEWVPIVIFNENLAKVADEYLRKGSRVYIEGKYTTREWEKDGQKQYRTEVVLSGYDCKLVMLGEKSGGGGGGGGRSRSRDDMDDGYDDGGGRRGGSGERRGNDDRGGGGRSSGSGRGASSARRDDFDDDLSDIPF